VELEAKGLLLLKSGRRVEGDLWKMEPKLDFREGMLSDGGGLTVDALRVDEVLVRELLRALERRAVKKGMFFVGAEEV
jgi:hypothetical protein